MHYVEDFAEDPAFRRSTSEGFRSAFSHLLRDVEIWLPHDFPFTFQASDPTGTDVTFGSLVELSRQLDALNRRTWLASDADLLHWQVKGADHSSPLEIGARFAFAIMEKLSRLAVQHRLVMKLD